MLSLILALTISHQNCPQECQVFTCKPTVDSSEMCAKHDRFTRWPERPCLGPRSLFVLERALCTDTGIEWVATGDTAFGLPGVFKARKKLRELESEYGYAFRVVCYSPDKK